MEGIGLMSNQAFDLMSRVFAYSPRNLGSIPGRVKPKTQKMLLDAALLNTSHYKISIKGNVEQSREWSITLGVVDIEKGAFESPSTMVAKFTYYLLPQWIRVDLEVMTIKGISRSSDLQKKSLAQDKSNIWFLCLIAYHPL